MKYLVYLAILLCSSSAFAQPPVAYKVLYKEFDLSFEPQAVKLIYSLNGQGLKAKTLSLSRLQKTDSLKYAVLGFVDKNLVEGQIVITGKSPRDNLSTPVTKDLLLNYQDFNQQQASSDEADTGFLSSETILEQKKLSQLRKNVAEISRLNRLVQAENTVSSLESRLKELQMDRQALAELIQLIPGQTLSPRQLAIENQLVLDARNIRQVYAKKGGALTNLSPEKERQLKNQIESASKLNAEDLKRKLIELKKAHEHLDLNEEPEGEIGTRHNPL